jgi:hypothetical protein
MDILLNLFEFYNWGFFIGFLFVDNIPFLIKYLYSIIYLCLTYYDKHNQSKFMTECAMTFLGMFICNSLIWSNYHVYVHINYFHFLVVMFTVLEFIVHSPNIIERKLCKLYAQYIFALILFTWIL